MPCRQPRDTRRHAPSQPPTPPSAQPPPAPSPVRVFTMTAEDLRTMRQRVGLSQAELARRLSYSRAAIHAWEAGERNIPQSQYQPVLDTLTAARLEQEAHRQSLAQLLGEGK